MARLFVVAVLCVAAAFVGCGDEEELAGGQGGTGASPQGSGGVGGSGAAGGEGGAAGHESVAAFDCDPTAGLPIDPNGCDGSLPSVPVFATCAESVNGPSITMQFVITPTPEGCPMAPEGLAERVVASECVLLMQPAEGAQVSVDWEPFNQGQSGQCFQSPDCPGHGIERYGGFFSDIPELKEDPFGMEASCDDLVGIAISCDGTTYECDYSTPE